MRGYLASSLPFVVALAVVNAFGLYTTIISGFWLLCLVSIASIDLILLLALMPSRTPPPDGVQDGGSMGDDAGALPRPAAAQPPAAGAVRLDPSLVLVRRVTAPARGEDLAQDLLAPVLLMPEPAPGQLKDKSAAALRAEAEELQRRLEQPRPAAGG